MRDIASGNTGRMAQMEGSSCVLAPIALHLIYQNITEIPISHGIALAAEEAPVYARKVASLFPQ